ncbi:MAG TPA: VOC family protein [Myxococcota bacterium]|nr:VOC family protein [Myxococcota bacterium]
MKIKSVIPQLRTTGLAASIRVDAPDPSIACVRAGEHLHLYLEVEGVASAAEELKRQGVRLVHGVHDEPLGTRELVLEDDQGHAIHLYENR